MGRKRITALMLTGAASRRLVAVFLACSACVHVAQAASTLVWDTDSVTAGVQDGVGNWEANYAWMNLSSGATATWNNSNNDIAQFGTATGGSSPYTVTLGVGIAARGLNRESDGA